MILINCVSIDWFSDGNVQQFHYNKMDCCNFYFILVKEYIGLSFFTR